MMGFAKLTKAAGYTGKGTRTGTPGHYQYSYDEEVERNQRDLFSGKAPAETGEKSTGKLVDLSVEDVSKWLGRLGLPVANAKGKGRRSGVEVTRSTDKWVTVAGHGFGETGDDAKRKKAVHMSRAAEHRFEAAGFKTNRIDETKFQVARYEGIALGGSRKASSQRKQARQEGFAFSQVHQPSFAKVLYAAVAGGAAGAYRGRGTRTGTPGHYRYSYGDKKPRKPPGEKGPFQKLVDRVTPTGRARLREEKARKARIEELKTELAELEKDTSPEGKRKMRQTEEELHRLQLTKGSIPGPFVR